MNNINVFTGPMKSGKSSTIIREAKSLINAGEKVQVFKPIIDDRFSIDEVKDRNGNSIQAIKDKKKISKLVQALIDKEKLMLNNH